MSSTPTTSALKRNHRSSREQWSWRERRRCSAIWRRPALRPWEQSRQTFMVEHRHLPHVSSFRDNPIVFFTTCTHKRRKLLACAESHVILRGLWERSAERDGWWVGHYILMPNPWRAGCRCGRASVRASSRQHWTSRRPFGNGITLIDIYGRGKIM